jgi:hypothetical protein
MTYTCDHILRNNTKPNERKSVGGNNATLLRSLLKSSFLHLCSIETEIQIQVIVKAAQCVLMDADYLHLAFQSTVITIRNTYSLTSNNNISRPT